MAESASRELRNSSANVLRRDADGEEITITISGRAIAEIVALRHTPTHRFTRDEVIDVITRHQADAAMRDDLKRLAGETSDDLCSPM